MINLNEIKQKKDKLEQTKEELKGQFVGLDDIIDKIFDNIEVWYIMPELLSRPVIINLWGMTGVGKTDLIRKIVHKLDFSENFVEIQMNTDNSSKSYHNPTVESCFVDAEINNNEQAILLLDEIQRFRSIDEDGKLLQSSQYEDVWMLLSDGRFTDDNMYKKDLFEMLWEEIVSTDRKSDVVEGDVPVTGDKDDTNRKYKMSVWSAKRFKDKLDLKQ